MIGGGGLYQPHTLRTFVQTSFTLKTYNFDMSYLIGICTKLNQSLPLRDTNFPTKKKVMEDNYVLNGHFLQMSYSRNVTLTQTKFSGNLFTRI